MSLLVLTLAAVLAAQVAPPPRSELETLRAEVEKLTVEARAKAARIQELQAEVDKAKKQAEQPNVARAAKSALQAIAPTPMTPTPPVYYHFALATGKVTAVANEIDLVVISIGSENGVAEGQTFTITRSGETVATLTIDRVDRKWAAGKVSKKQSDPRIGDEVGAQKSPTGQKWLPLVTTPASTPGSADELRSIRKELDEVRSQVRQLSDRIVPSWQGQGVSVEEAPEELRAHLSLLRGLLVRRVREGSPAEKAGLKVNDVVPDLLEAQLVQAIEMGMPIHVVRQGKQVRLTGAKGR